MPKMEIGAELHVPGLDLDPQRWNYHTLFMREIHTHFRLVAAAAWEHYCEQGRGTIYVEQSQWMAVIRGEWAMSERPFLYLSPEEAIARDGFGRVASGYSSLLAEYDPNSAVVLTVEQAHSTLHSCYLLLSDPGPEQAWKWVQEGQR